MKIAINGFGRIGRTFYRAACDDSLVQSGSTLDIDAINDLSDVKNLKYLLKYDTVYETFNKDCKAKFISEKDPEKLPWKKLGVDLVIESTGFFTKRKDAAKHLKAGAKKVIISAPSDTADVTIVPGVNEDQYNSEKHNIISMGSCTTNCIVPVVAVINDQFKIVSGSFTTIHSYTATQALVDRPEKKDVRRGRGAAENIVPTTTGAAKAIFQVFPKLKGKISALAIRVPTPAVSMIDFVCEVEKKVNKDQVNQAFINVVDKMSGAIAVSRESLVSTDYRSNPNAAIIDSKLTSVTNDHLIHVIAWYDNEMGYSYRMVKMCEYIMRNV